MKCIKEECSYYQWHLYRDSCFVCGLVNATFDVGNKVTENQIIASIDNKTNENNTASAKDLVVISKENLTENAPALQQLQQNIKFAESKYQQDKTQAERYKRLYNSQSIAKVECENIQLAAENSLSQLNALKKQYQQVLQQSKQNYINTENQLKNNQVVLGYNKLVVPQKGTIIKKLKFSGDYVKKGDVIAFTGVLGSLVGTALASIAKLFFLACSL